MRRVALIATFALIVAGIVAIPTLLADGTDDDDDRATHPILKGPPERATEVCGALPSFTPRAVEEFVVDARQLAPRAHATIGWYLEASSTLAKNRLARDLRRSGFRVASVRIGNHSLSLTANRRVELTARAVRRQRQRLDAASTAKSKRFVLQVAYPPDGCIDKDE